MQRLKNLNLKLKALTTTFIYFLLTSPAYANADTSQIDGVVDFIANWATKFGLIVAFFGGIQVALAFKNDDADGKTRGLRTLVAGFMVVGISKSLGLFGL